MQVPWSRPSQCGLDLRVEAVMLHLVVHTAPWGPRVIRMTRVAGSWGLLWAGDRPPPQLGLVGGEGRCGWVSLTCRWPPAPGISGDKGGRGWGRPGVSPEDRCWHRPRGCGVKWDLWKQEVCAGQTEGRLLGVKCRWKGHEHRACRGQILNWEGFLLVRIVAPEEEVQGVWSSESSPQGSLVPSFHPRGPVSAGRAWRSWGDWVSPSALGCHVWCGRRG